MVVLRVYQTRSKTRTVRIKIVTLYFPSKGLLLLPCQVRTKCVNERANNTISG
jgi:hypothetical protein